MPLRHGARQAAQLAMLIFENPGVGRFELAEMTLQSADRVRRKLRVLRKMGLVWLKDRRYYAVAINMGMFDPPPKNRSASVTAQRSVIAYLDLAREIKSIPDIARATGMSLRLVYRAVSALVHEGDLECTDLPWSRDGCKGRPPAYYSVIKPRDLFAIEPSEI